MNQFLGKIHTSDCNKLMDLLPDNCINLTVTSPPYDNLRKYKGFNFDFESIAKNLFRVTTAGGIVVWVVADQVINGSETGTSFKQALYFMQCGFKLHDTMIYRKLNFMPQTSNRYEQEFEYMFIFVKGKIKTFNPIRLPCKYAGQQTWGDAKMYEGNDKMRTVKQYTIKDTKIKANIFEYRTGSILKTKGHPAIFPAQLARDHIITWSNENYIVFDPFSGSGTTCEMAKKLNRRFIGCDISADYVTESNKRLKAWDFLY